MIYKTMAMEDLKLHGKRIISVQNLRDEIEALECEKISAKGISDSTPVMGGDINKQDSKLVDIISLQKRLGMQLAAVERHVNRVERALGALTRDERKVIERFYLDPQNYSMKRLQEELMYEKSKIYEIKDDALYNFTIALYGITDL